MACSIVEASNRGGEKVKEKKREDDKMYTFSQDTHRWLFFVHKASHLNLSWKEDSCNHIC